MKSLKGGAFNRTTASTNMNDQVLFSIFGPYFYNKMYGPCRNHLHRSFQGEFKLFEFSRAFY